MRRRTNGVVEPHMQARLCAQNGSRVCGSNSRTLTRRDGNRSYDATLVRPLTDMGAPYLDPVPLLAGERTSIPLHLLRLEATQLGYSIMKDIMAGESVVDAASGVPMFGVRLPPLAGRSSCPSTKPDPSRLDDRAMVAERGFEGIVTLYRKRLETVFTHVAPQSRRLVNQRGSPLFEFMFAAGNPKGGKIAVPHRGSHPR